MHSTITLRDNSCVVSTGTMTTVFAAGRGHSVTAMKDANLRLRKAVEQWRNRGQVVGG